MPGLQQFQRVTFAMGGGMIFGLHQFVAPPARDPA